MNPDPPRFEPTLGQNANSPGYSLANDCNLPKTQSKYNNI